MPIPNARISFTLRDSERKEYVMTLYSNRALTDLVPLLPDMKDVIAGVSDCVIAKIEVARQDPEPQTGVPRDLLGAVRNVDGEIKGQFAFFTEEATTTIISVPGFKRDLIYPDSNRIMLVDNLGGWLDNAAMDFVNMVVHEVGDAQCRDSRGSRIMGIKTALEAYSRRN